MTTVLPLLISLVTLAIVLRLWFRLYPPDPRRRRGMPPPDVPVPPIHPLVFSGGTTVVSTSPNGTAPPATDADATPPDLQDLGIRVVHTPAAPLEVTDPHTPEDKDTSPDLRRLGIFESPPD